MRTRIGGLAMRYKYLSTFHICGKLISIYDSRFGKSHKFRNLLVEAAPDSAKFSNSVVVTLTGDDCDLADTFREGQHLDMEGFVESYITANGGYRTQLTITKITKES